MTDNKNIIDIDLSATRKKRIRIDNDDNRILELDLSDLSVITRLSEATTKLDELQAMATNYAIELDSVSDDADVIATLGNQIEQVDIKMREIIDDIFKSNVSEVCAPTGTMYDPFNGQFRYEHIIGALIPLYNNISTEMQNVTARLNKHAGKYTKK